MSMAEGPKSRFDPGTLNPPPTAPTPGLCLPGCSWQEPRGSGVSWILSCPTPPLPRGSRALSLRLFPFLTRVQNNNNDNPAKATQKQKPARLRPVGPAASLRGATDALPALFNKEGACAAGVIPTPTLRDLSPVEEGREVQAAEVGRPGLGSSSAPLRASAGVPGLGQGGVVIIKQHLHRDFVYKALSQGGETRVAHWNQAGRPRPARPAPAGSGLCAGRTSAIHSGISDSPGFLLSLLSCEELAPACHSGRRRGVRGPRGQGPGLPHPRPTPPPAPGLQLL